MSFRDTFESGITEFNEGEYFACHDTLEEIWRAIRGESRRFFQGIIHAAAGLLHIERGNLPGSVSQLGKAIDKLRDYPSPHLGVDLERLLADLTPLREKLGRALEQGAPAPSDLRFPTISYTPDPLGFSALEAANDEHE